MEKIVLTDTERRLVEQLNHSVYTVDYLEEWINRNDNVYLNAPSALNAMGAKGFYSAVKMMAEKSGVSVGAVGK